MDMRLWSRASQACSWLQTHEINSTSHLQLPDAQWLLGALQLRWPSLQLAPAQLTA